MNVKNGYLKNLKGSSEAIKSYEFLQSINHSSDRLKNITFYADINVEMSIK